MLWLHLSAIIVWVGGLIAIPFVTVPAVRRVLPSGEAAELIQRIVRRFLRVSRELILIVFLSGIFNVLHLGYVSQFAYTERFLWIVGAKFVLFAAMAANQLWYSMRLVPTGQTDRASWSAIGGVVLAAVVIYLALILRG